MGPGITTGVPAAPKPVADRPLAAAPANPILSVATRSGQVESWHRGAVAVCHDGAPALALGDVERSTFVRSAVKPLQALPFLERGLAEQLGAADAELAVMCASHDGTEAHTAAVRSLLARGGLDEAQLGCGPHAPFDPHSRGELQRRGAQPGRLHNNCSGKHAGFLHLARSCGDDLARYLAPDSRAQREVQAAVAAMTGCPEPLELGLDGCGAPTFRLPLAGLARAFSRLANPIGLASVRAAACRRILAVVGRAPTLLAGERRFCTALVRAWPGACFAKNGAEGVYALALAPDPRRVRWPGGLGIAIKVDDGAERGYQPVVVDLLLRLGAFVDDQVPPALQAFHRLAIDNTQRVRVGEVHSVAPWELP